MSKVIEKTTEKLPKYVRRLTGGTYEARKMINGRTIRVSGKNLTEVMLEFEFIIKCLFFFFFVVLIHCLKHISIYIIVRIPFTH